ncbi:MAG: DEAD/DEAH box helicase family protein [Bacteroidales bacterium]|nr:DEAD/DEAH box helicase family protein [Bacteroidales bacterium]
MDYREKINDIISQINDFDNSREKHSKLIQKVCEIFDSAATLDLSESEMALLYYLANFIGIPQYYDLLCKINKKDDKVVFTNILFISSLLQEANLHIDNYTKVHIFQKEVIEIFNKNTQNRYLISAPTSFGKTFIIYHIINKMQYRNVALIFPTISLLSENLQKVMKLINENFLVDYKLITLSEEKPSEFNNLFIFTPERLMTFIDKNPNQSFDFVFMDEVYKIDNEYVSNDDNFELIETNRDIAFRIALNVALTRTIDCLLVGRYLNYENSNTMLNFFQDNRFSSINYNDIELVMKKQVTYKELRKNKFDNLTFVGKKSYCKQDKIVDILMNTKNEESIVYCPKKYLAEDYALKIADRNIYDSKRSERFEQFINHLENNYTKDWCVVKALKSNIGIHHGTIPKYIQREVINLFNMGILKCIFSTTTITEGVNTTAKNMIILSSKKGSKDLKKFDVLNIVGRAGRFNQHFSGRIFIIDDEIIEILESNDDSLTHKNYGLDTKKGDLDYAITSDDYLSINQKLRKTEIEENYIKNAIPKNIQESFLTILPEEKIELYRLISDEMRLNYDNFSSLIKCVKNRSLTLAMIDQLISLIKLVIKEDNKLFEYTSKGTNEYSVLTYMLNSYLIGGYKGMLSYQLNKNIKIDIAVRNVSNIVYNIFRYELAKHIGVIDLIYRTIYGNLHEIPIDEVTGFSSLLSYLEYGTYSEKGRKASDYGVSQNILKHLEDSSIEIDDYEKILFKDIEGIVG